MDANQTAHSIVEQVIAWSEDPQTADSEKPEDGCCLVSWRRDSAVERIL